MHPTRFIALAAVLIIAGCTEAQPEGVREERKVSVEVVEVREETREEVFRLQGTLEADREMKLGFKAGGKIEAIFAEEGREVARGALLARLDRTELFARRDKALEQKGKAERDRVRMERLFRDRTVAESTYQDAESLYITAEAELKIVEDLLGNSEIRAPFSGIVTHKLSEIGEVVGAGAPVAILTEMDPILLKAALPDSLVPRLKPGMDATVKARSSPRESYRGKVLRLEPTADPLSRTLRIVIRLANPGAGLRPGLIARVEIRGGRKAPGIYVPLDAVTGLGSRPVLFVARNSMAEKRAVQTGDISGTHIEILGGVSPGDLVIVSGQEYLKDRQTVTISKRGPASP